MLFSKWTTYLSELNIPHNVNSGLSDILSDPVKVCSTIVIIIYIEYSRDNYNFRKYIIYMIEYLFNSLKFLHTW